MNRYQAENLRLRAIYRRGKTALNFGYFLESGENSLKNCSRADYVRLSFVDEFASSLLIQAWLDEQITWGRLWKLASEFPGEVEAQAEALKKVDKRSVRRQTLR